MDSLSKEQKDILLDYYFDCASQEEIKVAESLLVEHDGASEFYSKLSDSLALLDHLDHEEHKTCPNHIFENTMAKLQQHQEHATGKRLGELLAVESQKPVTTKSSFWRSTLEIGAIAAMIVMFSGLFVPVTRHMRTQSWKTACNFNLSQISNGMMSYANDNEASLPSVKTVKGSPWWKVGSTETENHSNTRNLWLLVQNDYLRPEVFVCPGSAKGKKLRIQDAYIKNKNSRDFPDRRYITYSFKLICNPKMAKWPNKSSALMSDSNPIFDDSIKRIPELGRVDLREFDPVKLCEELMRANSSNHRRKGQNVLFSDGSVVFLKRRFVGSSLDDIFTVTGQLEYRGTETPKCESDIFLVP